MGLRGLGLERENLYLGFFFFFLILYIRVGFGLCMPNTWTQLEPRFRFFNENLDPTLMLNGSGWSGYSRVEYILPSLAGEELSPTKSIANSCNV